MLKQFSFYKPYKNFLKQGSEGQVLITDVDTEGDSLQELVDNATIGLEDWHGNSLQHCRLHDLADEDLAIVMADIKRIYALQAAQDSGKSKLEWADESDSI